MPRRGEEKANAMIPSLEKNINKQNMPRREEEMANAMKPSLEKDIEKKYAEERTGDSQRNQQ